MAKPEERAYMPVPPPAVRSSYACRPAYWQEVDETTWSSWVWQQQPRIRSLAHLETVMPVSARERVTLEATASARRMGATPAYGAVESRGSEPRPSAPPVASAGEGSGVVPLAAGGAVTGHRGVSHRGGGGGGLDRPARARGYGSDNL